MLASARVKAASGGKADIASALRQAASALKVASDKGFVSAQMDARLALVEIEARRGHAPAAARDLAVEAKKNGFGGVAARAERIAASAGKTADVIPTSTALPSGVPDEEWNRALDEVTRALKQAQVGRRINEELRARIAQELKSAAPPQAAPSLPTPPPVPAVPPASPAPPTAPVDPGEG
jgi:hypothetical protein